MNDAHPRRRPAGLSGFESIPVTIEPLEGRRLMAGDGLSLPPIPIALPGPPLDIPGPVLNIPDPSLGIPGPRTRRPSVRDINLRGFYIGTVEVNGLGRSDVEVDITRHRRGRITGSISLDLLGNTETLSGTVPVRFVGNRRFEITLRNGNEFVRVAGRLNRNNTVTGTIEGRLNGRVASGTFALTRLSGPDTIFVRTE